MKILDGEKIYRINTHDGHPIFVEADTFSELCEAVAMTVKKGRLVTGVVDVSMSKSTPRVKVMGTAEYADAIKKICGTSDVHNNR